MAININTQFDGGSIEVINISNIKDLHFKIRKDTNSHFAQWFYFQLNNLPHEELKFRLSELDKTAYPEGWNNYKVCVSYDNQYWFRLPAEFNGKELTFSITPEANTLYLAYFEPYPYQRHMDLIGYTNTSSLIKHEVLGQTHQGRNIDLVVTNSDKQNQKIKVWIIARQHPGETMAHWFMEGLIHRLLDEQDSVSRTLLQDCVFYIVPHMNPDGGFLGNLRVNSVGTNLNREWLAPSLEKSPEVYYVRNKMLETGVDIFLDIHGDEAIPYLFTAGCEDNPSFSKKQEEINDKFRKALSLTCADYQTKYGYERGQFSQQTATLATNWVGDKFDCLALTLEMPFKDNDNLPDPIYGWNSRRSYLLGQSMLSAINVYINE